MSGVHTAGINCILLFFFNGTATTEIYTLSLHDALPIYRRSGRARRTERRRIYVASIVSPVLWSAGAIARSRSEDRKSTRLNSSHQIISYAVFCLKKKKDSYL